MRDPILLISFDDKLGNRICRFLRRSGLTVERFDGVVPDDLRPCSAVVLAPAAETELGAVYAILERWNKPLFAFALIIAVMATWKHRTNFKRLRAGTEARFTTKSKDHG